MMIAILDRRLRILHLNAGWRDFAVRKRLKAAEYRAGVHFPDLCSRGRACAELGGWQVAQGLRKVLANTATSLSIDYTARISGCERWLQASISAIPTGLGSDGGVVVAYTDTTDQKLHDSKLQQLNNRLLAIVDSFTDAFFVVDSDWCVTYANTEMVKLTERPKHRLLGASLGDVLPAELVAVLWRQGQREVRSIHKVEFSPRLQKWIEIQGYRMSGGFAIYLRDVTAQRNVEEQLSQWQRHEAIGRLTGGIAHDFNNLLMVMLGNAEILTEALGEQPKLQELARLTKTAAERGAELTNRLLAVARKQPLDPTVVDANELVGGLEPLLRRTLGEHIEVKIVPHEEVLPVHVDTGQLENTLLNLCINARDAMPDGGGLTIELANATPDDALLHDNAGHVPGGYAMISVSDTGTGMTADVREHAFEPFFSTKDVDQGSGLGLSMVYGFVKQSRGHIKIDSAPGKGTTVTLYFPKGRGTLDERGPGSGERLEKGNGERVLLVEDNELVRDHVNQILESLGYRVTAARNGPDALAILCQDTTFDLLLTDVVMPGGLNGRELADRAKVLHPRLPVLFMSGYTEHAMIRSGWLKQGDHFLTKPYRRADLAAQLGAMLNRTREKAQ